MNKYKLILATSLMLVPTALNLNAESTQKNYVNWCSDPGSGGCPVARVPYMTPVNNQLTPHIQPMLVPRMLPVLQPCQYMAVPQLQQAPNLVPNRVPNLVPQLVPNRVPYAVPNRVPNLEPKPMEVKVPQQVLPTQKTPNLIVVPKYNQLTPQPIEQRVPTQVLPTQKIPGFAKTLGRPGEINLETKPKETPMIEKREYEYNKTRVVELIPTKYSEQIEKFKKLQNIQRLENKIIKQHLDVVNAVRGASKIKQDPTTFVLGGLAVATSLVVKRRKND